MNVDALQAELLHMKHFVAIGVGDKRHRSIC